MIRARADRSIAINSQVETGWNYSMGFGFRYVERYSRGDRNRTTAVG